MNWTEFTRWGEWVSQWAAKYHGSLRDRPVRAQTRPGDIAAQLPDHPPETGEGMETILADFENVTRRGPVKKSEPSPNPTSLKRKH